MRAATMFVQAHTRVHKRKPRRHTHNVLRRGKKRMNHNRACPQIAEHVDHNGKLWPAICHCEFITRTQQRIAKAAGNGL
jgi:hypothetical protein